MNFSEMSVFVMILLPQKESALQNDTSRSEMLDRIRELQEFIAAQPSEINEFDEGLVNRITNVTVFFSVLNKPGARFAQFIHIEPTIASDNGIVFQISGFAAREKNTFISKTLQKVIDRFAGEPKITSDISC